MRLIVFVWKKLKKTHSRHLYINLAPHSGVMHSNQQTLRGALTCAAALLRFWGYRLQVMNAPPIFLNLHINLYRLSHRDYYVPMCPCLCVFLPVCICWLYMASYLQGNSEGLLETHPNCEVNDVRKLTDAAFLHIYLTVEKKGNLWKFNNTVRRGIFEKKMCCITSTRCPPENWFVEVTSQLIFGYRERIEQPRFILAVTTKLRLKRLKGLLLLTECFLCWPLLINKEQRD